jgi:hypothetical protein
MAEVCMEKKWLIRSNSNDFSLARPYSTRIYKYSTQRVEVVLPWKLRREALSRGVPVMGAPSGK